MTIDISSSNNWVSDLRNMNMSSNKEIESYVLGWNDENKRTLFNAITMYGINDKKAMKENLDVLTVALISFGQLPKNLMPKTNSRLR